MTKTRKRDRGTEYRAKIFRNGRSQAIRLPKELRFGDEEKEVRVWREQGRLVVESVDEWPEDLWRLFGSIPDLETSERTPLAEARDRFNR